MYKTTLVFFYLASFLDKDVHDHAEMNHPFCM